VDASRKQDIILAGVGGQGILSIASIIDHAALEEGFEIKQAEVHGMAQRGGAVHSHLRLSKNRIFSDLIPRGEADLIISVEPLEALRYLGLLRPGGKIVTSSTPYANIPDYPEADKLLTSIRRIEGAIVLDSEALAREAGSSKTQNTAVLGAASRYLIVSEESLVREIHALFTPRGPRLLEVNLKAFELGRKAAG
jgi:indolepyruvate ferredoxin oxidoreductase beta subunit